MSKVFVIGYDGFLKREAPMTFEEAKIQWNKDVQNRRLYEYVCAVYELNDTGDIVREVPFSELTV